MAGDVAPPAGEPSGAPAGAAQATLRDRMRGGGDDAASARPPLPGPSALRFVVSALLTLICLLTVGGAILMMLLWQQDRASGVLSTQLDRTWDLFDVLRHIERWLAFAVVPVATAWIALATVNVRRGTGRRRNPVVAAASLPLGLAGIWLVGRDLVAGADDWIGQGAGFVLQVVLAAIPLLALERLVDAAEARHRPLHVAWVIGMLYLAHVQFLGGLSTIERTDDPSEWTKVAAYLVIAALMQVLGALAANEAARSIEEGTEQRYQLRHRFGESLLAQAATRI